MSGINNTPLPTHPQVLLDPMALVGNLDQVKQQGQTSVKQALQNLGVLIASPNASASGAQQLQKPSAMNLSNVSDMTLRMGLLQEALNQLQQQVSKDQIQARLTEQHQDNTKQLEQMNAQMKKIQDAYQKSQDAHKKTNIFQAIADFFKAIVDAICMVFTAIAAVGEALVGDEVGAAGLFASSVAMAGAFVVDTVLAVNQAIVAAGGQGLGQNDLNNLEKASEALGIIAGAAGMLGGVGALVEGLQDVAAIVGQQALKEGVELSTQQVAKEVASMAKSAIQDAFKEGLQNIKSAFKEVFERSFSENMSKLGEAMLDGVKNFNPARGINFDKDAAGSIETDVDAVAKREESSALRSLIDGEAKSYLKESDMYTDMAKTADNKEEQKLFQGLAKKALQEACTQTIKDAMINVTALSSKIGMVQGIGDGTAAVVKGAGQLAADNLSAQAAELQKEADQDAAKVKALEAQIAKLEKLIQQLQDDLQKMMQGMMNSVSSILSAASQSSESVGKLIQSTHV